MKKIKILLQYDGTAYSGWQIQPDRITIQGLIEDALKQITGSETRIIAAGRTDAGVHAIEQVAAFRTDSNHSPDVFRRALNGILPPDIRILSATYVDEDFHPRYSAKSKRYVYIINNSSIKNPFLIRFSYHVSQKLDTEKMKRAAEYLLGRHDFKAFQGSGCSAKTTIREIKSLEITELTSLEFLAFRFEGRYLKISIEANAFLRFMVRNIVGTLIEIGRGRMEPQEMERILNSRDRRSAGPTAPAQGLFLERVFY